MLIYWQFMGPWGTYNGIWNKNTEHKFQENAFENVAKKMSANVSTPHRTNDSHERHDVSYHWKLNFV